MSFCFLYRADLGTADPVALDVLINSLAAVSSEYGFLSLDVVFISRGDKFSQKKETYTKSSFQNTGSVRLSILKRKALGFLKINDNDLDATRWFYDEIENLFLIGSHVGIKELTFGGKQLGDWDEGMTVAEDGYISYKIQTDI